MILPFQSRTAAGRILAGKLGEYAGKKDTIILGLVRGGIEIGAALSSILKLPLHPYIVRKLGHPSHRDGIGAIGEGGATYLDEKTMRSLDLEWEDMEPVIEEEMLELRRRKEAYSANKRPSFLGKSIILTDDGAATGGTMFAAVEDLRKAGVQKIVIALPVSPPGIEDEFLRIADDVIILATPEPFEAVGKWYVSFPQLTDEDVLQLLK